jgi:hypothetical protein
MRARSLVLEAVLGIVIHRATSITHLGGTVLGLVALELASTALVLHASVSGMILTTTLITT